MIKENQNAKREPVINKVVRWIMDRPPVKLTVLILVTLIAVGLSSSLVLAMTNKPLFNNIKDHIIGPSSTETSEDIKSSEAQNSEQSISATSTGNGSNQTSASNNASASNSASQNSTKTPSNSSGPTQTNKSQVVETGIEIVADDNFIIPKCAFTSADFQYKSIPISLKLKYSDGSSKAISLDEYLTFDHQKLLINASTNLISLGINYQTYSSNYSNFPEFQTSISAAYKQWTYTKKINVQSSDNCSLSVNLESVKIPEGLYVIATYGQDGKISSSTSNINGALFIYPGGPSKTYPFSKGTISVVDQSVATTPGTVYGFNVLNAGKTFIDFTYKSLTARGEITFTKK